MANSDKKIIVCSKSFSKNITLREEMSKAFPNTQFNDNSLDFNSDELVEFIGSAAGVVVGLEPINDLVFRKCSNLKIVSKYGVGLDNVDLVAAQEHKVKIGWTGGVNRRSVSEMVLCFMIGYRAMFYFLLGA